MREGLAGQQEGALDVDVEDLVPLILAALEREKSMRRKCFQVTRIVLLFAAKQLLCGVEVVLGRRTYLLLRGVTKKGPFIPGRMDCTYLLRGMR